MASEQQKQMNEVYASIKGWLWKPDIDLSTRRDIAENAHLAATEPRRSHTLKWIPVACRRYGAFRRAATRTAFCCTPTPAVQSSSRCILIERRLGTSPRW